MLSLEVKILTNVSKYDLFWIIRNKTIYSVLVAGYSLHHSLLVWQGGKFTVWVLCVQVICKAAVWHLVTISKKIGEMKTMKKNPSCISVRCRKWQVYLCIVTEQCFWNCHKQKTSTYVLCETNSHLLPRKYVYGSTN